MGTRAGDRERVRDRISRRQKAAQSAYAEENRVREQESARNAVPQGAVGTGAKARTLSASAAYGGSFYIYSYDGRLLAEYDGNNECVKDYIYMGNRLLAEYKPQESRTYFYTPDQINSTRIVTDESGTVVYSAAHDPYGGIQQTWVNTFDPTPKFSGKERDSESGLDYFGARYYDKSQYRFISVDPVITILPSQSDSQMWNRYTYCSNNPEKFKDPSGKYEKNFHYGVTLYCALKAGFSLENAKIIAAACQYVDDNPKTTSTKSIETATNYHFPTPEILDGWESYFSSELADLKDLGTATHPVGDSYSHKGLKPGLDSGWEHFWNPGVDHTSNNIPKAIEATKTVLDLMLVANGKDPGTVTIDIDLCILAFKKDSDPITVLVSIVASVALSIAMVF